MTTTIIKGRVMNRLLRSTGRRVGRAIRTAGRRYGLRVAAVDDARPVFVGGDDLEIMAKYDPINFAYYVR